VEKAGQIKTFYSRQAWVRFAREDATATDWKEAATQRSLEGLKPTVWYYRVRPGERKAESSKLKGVEQSVE
jgi:hypothetical protein